MLASASCLFCNSHAVSLKIYRGALSRRPGRHLPVALSRQSRWRQSLPPAEACSCSSVGGPAESQARSSACSSVGGPAEVVLLSETLHRLPGHQLLAKLRRWSGQDPGRFPNHWSGCQWVPAYAIATGLQGVPARTYAFVAGLQRVPGSAYAFIASLQRVPGSAYAFIAGLQRVPACAYAFVAGLPRVPACAYA